MKVLIPVGKENKINQGYSSKHTGYDFDDIPDKNVYSSFHGTVVISKNSETRTWIANTPTDPYKNDSRRPKLITEDYGNYVKIRAKVDGMVVYQLCAHLQQGTVLPKGTLVTAGQVIGRIGNTGNSTGDHTHVEYRDADDKCFPVEFIDEENPPVSEIEKLPKDSVIRDFYKASKVTYDDAEVNRWLQENKNLLEVFTSVLEGDGAVRAHLLQLWNIDIQTDKQTVINELTETINKIKDVLRPVGYQSGSSTEELLGLLAGLISELQERRKQAEVKTIYKSEGKEFDSVLTLGNMKLIIEKGGVR